MAQQISVYERDKSRLQGQLQQVKQAQATEKSLYEKRIKDIKNDQQTTFSMAQTAKKTQEAKIKKDYEEKVTNLVQSQNKALSKVELEEK